jgi:hypothetical protein
LVLRSDVTQAVSPSRRYVGPADRTPLEEQLRPFDVYAR